MTFPSESNAPDDESQPTNALRRVLRLLAAIETADRTGRIGPRSFGRGVIDSEIRIGTLESALPDRATAEERDRPAPHLVTRETGDGHLIVVDLDGIDPDDVGIYRDSRAESVVIDAPGHRRRRTPLPSGHGIARTEMRNGVLEIRLEPVDDNGGDRPDE